MTTIRLVNSPLRCRCGERMIVETDVDGAETHVCLECDRRVVIDRDGFGYEPWKLEHCKRCSRPVIWASTLRGKRIPLDLKPSPAGRYQLQTGKQGLEASYVPMRRSNLRTNHRDTCEVAS